MFISPKELTAHGGEQACKHSCISRSSGKLYNEAELIHPYQG